MVTVTVLSSSSVASSTVGNSNVALIWPAGIVNNTRPLLSSGWIMSPVSVMVKFDG